MPYQIYDVKFTTLAEMERLLLSGILESKVFAHLSSDDRSRAVGKVKHLIYLRKKNVFNEDRR